MSQGDDVRDAVKGLVVRSDAAFGEAAREWLRYAAEDRACKPTTIRDYRASEHERSERLVD